MFEDDGMPNKFLVQPVTCREKDEAVIDTQATIISLRAQLQAAEAQLSAMTEDRDLWQNAHDDDCPNKAMLETVEAQLRQAHEELSKYLAMNEGETIIGGIRNLAQAFYSDRDNADTLEAQLRQEREAREQLNERIKNQSWSLLDYQEDKTAREAFIAESREQWQAQVAQLQTTISQYKKTLADIQPRTFPFDCELCGKVIESTADYDWHGIGDCALICGTCDGNGFVAQKPKEKPMLEELKREGCQGTCTLCSTPHWQLQATISTFSGALEELCDGIEGGGGTDGNGDTFDLTRAIAALAEITQKPEEEAKP